MTWAINTQKFVLKSYKWSNLNIFTVVANIYGDFHHLDHNERFKLQMRLKYNAFGKLLLANANGVSIKDKFLKLSRFIRRLLRKLYKKMLRRRKHVLK